MNKSEAKGYKWLLKKGYKKEEIAFQRKGIDFICADGKGYEVKRLYGHVIWFHIGQLERTKGENNSVLVFDDDKEEPIAVMQSMDLEKDKVISGIKITIAKKDYQAGYKTINIKEEVIEKIRNYEENKEEIEQNRFNLAGFVSRVLLEYMNKEKTDKEVKKEGLTKEGLREVLRERKEQGNITTTDTNAGITIEDLKRELINVEIETVDKIKAKIEELKYV